MKTLQKQHFSREWACDRIKLQTTESKLSRRFLKAFAIISHIVFIFLLIAIFMGNIYMYFPMAVIFMMDINIRQILSDDQ